MPVSEQVMILSAGEGDTQLLSQPLAQARLQWDTCRDVGTLVKRLEAGMGLAIVSEEALAGVDLDGLTRWIERQPPWSDFPFILLTPRAGSPHEPSAAARLSDLLGNVILLERPFHPATLLGMVRSALRGRRRQYQARAQMEAVQENEERLGVALLAGRLGTWELDLAAMSLHASEQCRAHFGRPDDVFTYATLVACIHPDDRPCMQAAIEHTIATGVDYMIDYRVVWPDGTIRWLEIRGRRVRDRRGTRLIGVSRDITEQKRAEAELLRFSETLEQQVQERTAELHHKEEALRHIQKMEAIGQLTGGVAHDFNNLLMAVLGNLDLLERRLPDDPQLHRYLDGAKQGAQRGAALTQRLLAFARRQDLKPEPVDVAALINNIQPLIERSLGPLVILDVDLPDGLPPAVADTNQLELAILNLAVNARDAMPKGGNLTITLEQAEPPASLGLGAGSYLKLAIADTGIGMDEATLERAIEPFFSTKERGKGTGLGLSMVHGLVVQLGGMLSLYSKPGAGTTAELWLPVSEACVQPAESQVEKVDQASISTILVVDDDALIAMSTVDMLEDLGHTVLDAYSGRQALEILESGVHVDAIITDHAMPGMTGVEFAIKARELRPDIPILLATGYADLPAGVEVDLPRLGKPYQQRDLEEKLSELFAQRSRIAAGGRSGSLP